MLGSLISGIAQSKASSDAAAAQTSAANAANRMQKRMYEDARADQMPFREVGLKALSGLGDSDFSRDFTAVDFQQDPGYAFRMAEGQKALERSAAARGGLQSGATLRSLTRYSQGVASDEFQRARDNFNADRDRRFGRLSTLAGMGQGATNQMGAAGQNYANQYGANKIGAGNAVAANNIAQGNIWGGMVNNVTQNALDAATMGMSGGMGGGGGGGNWMSMWKGNR
jgi:hypothetical protein